MEPNKFEKHIKKQLQEREIQPSTNAWERISERLEPSSEAKGKKFLWYAVAASFIGILTVSVLFFQFDDKPLENDVQIVDADENTVDDKTYDILDSISDFVEENIVENDRVEEGMILEQDVPSNYREVESKTQIAEIESKDLPLDPTEKTLSFETLEEELVNNKILEIVAMVDSLEQKNTTVTNAEVEELLLNAQNEILRDRLFEQNGSVDAMALLTEVEDELDQSFRDQIFTKLKSGFFKIRTAVADRNK